MKEEIDTRDDFVRMAACIMSTDNLGEAFAKAEATRQSERGQTRLGFCWRQ
jgi:hypothetical protein